MRENFWQNFKPSEWSLQEWEALCDGCGKCCLIRLEDEDTGKFYDTDLHCKLFDSGNCNCSDYENRQKFVPDCVRLDAQNIYDLPWLPKTCAYRLIAEGKPLFDWHYLVSGSNETIHERGFSVKNQTQCETKFKVKHWPKRIKVWAGEE